MTFYLHWIDVGTTDAEWKTASTWNAAYAVSDEDVLSLTIDHEEGQVPSMTVQVRNPKVGLLNPSRKIWAWMSWDGAGYVEPLFFGRLVGIPTDLLGEAITLQFTARSKNYLVDKQIAAEGLKVRPYYDPVFIDVIKRDDPDAILEGYSALWHVDRVTLAVSPSDILVGEDGNSIFLPSEVPYESVSVNLLQPPLIAVAVNADVSWTQEYTGYIDTDTGTVKTYSGDGIMSDWPRPASDLGSGWRVISSFVKDLNHIENVQPIQYSVTWQNNEKNHNDGDTLSRTVSYDYPNFTASTGYVWREISRREQIGLLDPRTVDIYGNPSPTNIPASLEWNRTYVPQWRIKYGMGLRYDSNRSRTERIEFILKANAQPILATTRVSEDTDTINITGSNVGEPIINFLNWTSVAGKYVDIGTFVFPDNPLVAGQKSIQVCVVAGIAGTSIPTFSNIAGQTTQDGTVVWSSLGYANGIYNISTDWQRDTLVPLGEIILPRVPFSLRYKDYVAPNRALEPPVGTNVDLYFIVEVPNRGFYECSRAGITGTKNPDWKTNGGITKDGTVEWTFIGTKLPTGVDYYICTHSGQTGAMLPRFGEGATLVNDEQVVWTKIAASEIPIGGSPGLIGRNDYFPTDRGRWSIEYLMCLARARLRLRSRAVEIGFECRFERVTKLSCRMNATIYDSRLPGGVATGKIISYSLVADGDKGMLIGKVKIGSAIGYDTILSVINGTATYVSDDYVEPAYQEHIGSVNPATDDMGYTPPISNVDDPYNFPLSAEDAFLNGGIVQRGSLAKQEAGIISALESAWIAANYTPTTIDSVTDSLLANRLALEASKNSVEYQLQMHPIWLELELRPVAGLSYDNFYSIETTDLHLPKLIDLEASSTATPPVSGGNIVYATADFQGVANRTIFTNIPLGHTGSVLEGTGTVGVYGWQTTNGSARTNGNGVMSVIKFYFNYNGPASFNGAAEMLVRTKPMRGAFGNTAGAGTMVAKATIQNISATSMSASGDMVAKATIRNASSSAMDASGTLTAVGS